MNRNPLTIEQVISKLPKKMISSGRYMDLKEIMFVILLPFLKYYRENQSNDPLINGDQENQEWISYIKKLHGNKPNTFRSIDSTELDYFDAWPPILDEIIWAVENYIKWHNGESFPVTETEEYKSYNKRFHSSTSTAEERQMLIKKMEDMERPHKNRIKKGLLMFYHFVDCISFD